MLKGSKMSKAKLQEIRKKRAEKRKAAKGKSAQYLADVLGAGINQTYDALEAGKVRGAFRFGKRWIIPIPVIERILREGLP